MSDFNREQTEGLEELKQISPPTTVLSAENQTEVPDNNDEEEPRTEFGRYDYVAVGTVFLSALSYVWGISVFGKWHWPIFAVVFLGANYLYAKMQKATITLESHFYALLVLASGVCITVLTKGAEGSTEITLGFAISMYMFYHCFGVYFVLTLHNNRINGLLTEWVWRDEARGIFYIPLANCYRFVQVIGRAVGSFFSKMAKGRLKASGRAKQVLLGILLGCTILMIAVPLLMSADKVFSDFIMSIGKNLVEFFSGLQNIVSFRNFLTFIVACYLYGLLYGTNKTTVPVVKEIEPKFTLAAVTCQIVVCGLYLLFFTVKIIDAISTVSMGSGTFVYSEYAREGFFELCWIASLNAAIYYLVRYLAKWEDKRVKVLSTALCVETIAFIALAFYKMYLYIDAYGFTFKRIITSWFMVVILVAFVLFIYKTWKDTNVVPLITWFGAVSLLIVSYVCAFLPIEIV